MDPEKFLTHVGHSWDNSIFRADCFVFSNSIFHLTFLNACRFNNRELFVACGMPGISVLG